MNRFRIRRVRITRSGGATFPSAPLPIAAMFLLAASLVPWGPLSAQGTDDEGPDPFLLPDIVVTGTRSPIIRAHLPTPATVLSGAALRESGVRTVAEALRLIPGMAVVPSGATGAQTSLFLRGGQSNYVKVLVDGVPVNEAGGAIDIADLSTEQVERIEVVRGPVSVLYGSDAVAGVVQIFTLRGRGASTLDIGAMGGLGERRHAQDRYGLLDLDATLSGALRGLSYAVGGGHSRSGGVYPLNNERSLYTGNARIAWQGDQGSRVGLATRFSESEAGFPTDGAGNLVDENAALDRRFWTGSLEAAQRLGERLEGQLQVGLVMRDQLARDEQDNPADTFGTFASVLSSELRRSWAEVRLLGDLGPGTVTLGVAHESTRGATAYDAESEWGPSSVEADFERANRAAYAQFLAELLPGVHVTAGARMDRNEAFGGFATHRLGLSWEIGGGIRGRAALGRAFREPTFAESFGSGFGDQGNPELVPERARSWEVGLEREVGPFLLGAGWFDQHFRDLIQYTFATADPGDPNYRNVGAAEAVGLEVTGEGTLGRVALAGSFTHLRTRVLDPGLATDATFVEGEALLRRPARSGTLTSRVPLAGGVVGLALNLTGAREDMDFGAGFPAPRVTLPRYGTLDLSGERALPLPQGPEGRLLVRIDNLFDAEYETIHGFPGPGRIVRLGLRLGVGG